MTKKRTVTQVHLRILASEPRYVFNIIVQKWHTEENSNKVTKSPLKQPQCSINELIQVYGALLEGRHEISLTPFSKFA